MTTVITAAWAVALIVVAVLRASLPSGDRWWFWTCVAGLVLGLFAQWYVPRLKRSRARVAQRRAAAAAREEPAGQPGDQPAGSPADR